MKLDKAYIIDKVDKLIYSIDWEWNSPNEKIFEEIVMSIVRDSYNAGAEAQKVADKAAVRKLEIYTIKINENASGCGLLMGDVDAAIQGAAVTFEEGE